MIERLTNIENRYNEINEELMKPEIDELLRKTAEIEKKRGEEKKQKELIMNCLKKNRTVEEIADFLGIPLEEVKAIAEQE